MKAIMKKLILLTPLAFFLGTSSCKNQLPAQKPQVQVQPEPSQPIPAPPDDEQDAPDINDPGTLARAVFDALRKGDAELYLKQNVYVPQDFLDASKLTGEKFFPVGEELDGIHQKIKDGFKKYLGLLKEKGLDPSQAKIKEIKTDKAVVKEGLGFAEDLTLVLQQGDTVINVTIDDVMLSSRGWLIIDGLKLRE